MNPPGAPPSTDPAPTHAPFLGSTTAPSSTSFYTNVTEQDSYPTLHSILEQQQELLPQNSNGSDHHLLSSVIYDMLDSIEQIATLLRTTLVYVSGTHNEFGDVQLGVDLQADAILWRMARTSRVIDYAASEEDPVLRNVKTSSSSSSSSSHGEHGGFAVCWDPLDGSSIVDNNWAVGTIIGVWPTGTSSGDDTKNDDGSSFFTSGTVTGRHQATSIMAMYGPRTTVLIALADGTYEFTFGCGTNQKHGKDTPSESDRHDLHHTKEDAGSTTMESADDNDSERHRRHGRTGQLWSCTRARMVLSPDTSCRIFSPANLRVTTELSWYQSIVQYYMNQRYTLRYTGGLVPDLYQQFTKGMGIYMNPVSQKSPAKLRLTFEVAPVALLIERAGGMTSDCSISRTDNSSDTADTFITSILDLPITSIDQRTAFCGGTANEVQRFHRMMFEGMHKDENA